MIENGNDYQYAGLMSVYVNESPQLLKRALNSVLKQNYPPADFILVKDGQLTEELESVIRDEHQLFERADIHFIELKNSKNLGLGRSLNKGLKACKNELVARFDSDDLSLPQRMTKTIEWFREHPDTAIVGTQIYEYDHDEHHPFDIKQVPIDYEHIKKESVVRNPFNHMSVTFKKSVINKVGGYIDVPLFEDYYLWLRVIRAKYPVTNLEDVLVKAHVNREFAHKRGGMHYLKKELHFQNILVRDGFLDLPQYLCNVLIRGTIRLLPPDLLLVVYKFLRKL
ncbi:glycosyltransferase [Lactiplantibacillus plantarum]|uniref:glycosyltransferase n=1 Tax=Lactiplantibacillus plantarum TaxID=1590 RepID=UPI00223EF527|nr:glycosyltransferase [Lactiplantibacillus plantarum]